MSKKDIPRPTVVEISVTLADTIASNMYLHPDCSNHNECKQRATDQIENCLANELNQFSDTRQM